MIAKLVEGNFKAENFLSLALPVTIKDFPSCIGTISENLLEVYLKGLVSFTHFIKIIEEYPQSFNDSEKFLLEQTFCRSLVIILPNNALGVDLIIPLLTNSNSLS